MFPFRKLFADRTFRLAVATALLAGGCAAPPARIALDADNPASPAAAAVRYEPPADPFAEPGAGAAAKPAARKHDPMHEGDRDAPSKVEAP